MAPLAKRRFLCLHRLVLNKIPKEKDSWKSIKIDVASNDTRVQRFKTEKSWSLDQNSMSESSVSPKANLEEQFQFDGWNTSKISRNSNESSESCRKSHQKEWESSLTPVNYLEEQKEYSSEDVSI